MSLNTVVTDTESTLSHWQQPFWFAVVGFCLGLLGENLDWLYTDANGQHTSLIGFEMPLRWAFIVFLPVALLLWRTGKNMAVPIYLAILLVLAAWSGWNAQVEISADVAGYYVSTNFMSIAFPLLLIGVVAISLPFVQTWQKQRPHWQYASLFAHAWDNTHTVLIAYAFATLSFLVLFLGALLLTTVGIDREQLNFVQQLTEHYLPITLAATGAGIGIIQQFSHVLLRLHTLVFTLYRLLAYLTAIIAVIFTLFLMPTLQTFLADKDANASQLS